jgi:dihydroneopterin aldolase
MAGIPDVEENPADGILPAVEHDRGLAQRLDRISLRGISAHGHHGVFEFERERGQRFVVDVVCWLELDAAAHSDDLADTLDYGSLSQAVAAEIEGEPLNLIEALAGRIADTCLASPRVQTVEVTVHKPEAPINADVADVAVTLTRSRIRD